MLRLGEITPDDEVNISVYSPAIVVRVEVIANGDTTLFSVERNGSVSVAIGQQPFYRAADISVRISEICGPCKNTGWEYVHYSQDSFSPHFQVFLLSVGFYATLVFVGIGNWLVVSGRLRVRRGWLVLIAVPVVLFLYGYYLWAFRDPNYVGLGLGALTSTLAVLGLFFALERRSQPVAEASISTAQIVDSVAIARDAERDRRQDTIERRLETLYSPLYEVLRRARFETNDFKAMVIAEWSRKEGRVGPRDCVLSEEELAKVREIVERHGHYMDPVEQAKLTKVLSNPDSIGGISGERLKQPWHLFWNAEIDPRFDYIKKTRDALIRELSDLTGSHDVRVG